MEKPTVELRAKSGFEGVVPRHRNLSGNPWIRQCKASRQRYLRRKEGSQAILRGLVVTRDTKSLEAAVEIPSGSREFQRVTFVTFAGCAMSYSENNCDSEVLSGYFQATPTVKVPGWNRVAVKDLSEHLGVLLDFSRTFVFLFDKGALRLHLCAPLEEDIVHSPPVRQKN